MDIYLQGLTMGLAYVAPIGLQNLFVINTALTQKRSRVFLTALIVIFFDITLGLACFLGVGALMQALPWLQKVILAVGSLIVVWIGIGLLRSKATMDTSTNVNLPIWKVITSACVVTWFNPQAIIDGTMMLGQPARRNGRLLYCRIRQRQCDMVPGHLGSHFPVLRPVQRQDPHRHQQNLRRCHHFLRRQAAVELRAADGLVLSKGERTWTRWSTC